MLYALKKKDEKFSAIEPLGFSSMALEKDLEDLLAKHLWDVLFAASPLLPIAQERPWQPDADIYAINEAGDVVIFELKRGRVDQGAVHQVLRYCERVSRFSYNELERRFLSQNPDGFVSLNEAHRTYFQLEHPLDKSAFNQRQHLMIVGSASDHELVRNVAYWKSRGLSIDFTPYRIYEIAGQHYFEFFSLPFDEHANPAEAKGVLVDTNSTNDEDGIWYMCENSRVAVFGDIMNSVQTFRKGDIAFLYQKRLGVVAAGEVTGPATEDPSHPNGAMYCKVRWLTPVPKRGEPLKALPVSEIRSATGRNFWWAKTLKYPYLDRTESNLLIEALKRALA